jgi:hypothetical protein
MSKVYSVSTFGATNWTACETAAKVVGNQRISRGVYSHPAIAKAVAQHAVGLCSCTVARVAECDGAEAAASVDMSASGGRGWRWVA